MNILGVFIFCLAVGSKIIWRSWWNRRGNEVPTNSWHNIFEAGKHLIGKLVLREELEEPSTGSNYTESFFAQTVLRRGKLPFHQQIQKPNPKQLISTWKRPKMPYLAKWGVFWHQKHSPPVAGTGLSSERPEIRENCGGNLLESTGVVPWEMPWNSWCQKKWMTSWWLKHLIFEKSISSNWKHVPQEQYQKFESTIWMMTWKFDLTWKKTSPPGLAITTT